MVTTKKTNGDARFTEVTLFYHPPSFNFFSIIFYHLPSSISLISFSSSVEHQFLFSILIFSSFYHTLSLSSLINTRRSFSLSLSHFHFFIIIVLLSLLLSFILSFILAFINNNITRYFFFFLPLSPFFPFFL